MNVDPDTRALEQAFQPVQPTCQELAAPLPKRTRGPSRKTREALKDEYNRGYCDCLQRDRGPEMIGAVLIALVSFVLGVGVTWLWL